MLAELMEKKFGRKFTTNNIAVMKSRTGITNNWDRVKGVWDVPIGTEKKVTITTRSRSYYVVKVAFPDVWEKRCNVVWEKYTGHRVDEDHYIIHLDLDYTNDRFENLFLIPREAMNNWRYIRKTPYAELNCTIALICMISAAERRRCLEVDPRVYNCKESVLQKQIYHMVKTVNK